MNKKKRTKVVELEIDATNGGSRSGTVRVRVPHDVDEDALEQLAEEILNHLPSDGLWDDDDMIGCWEIQHLEVETLSADPGERSAPEYQRLPGGAWERKI